MSPSGTWNFVVAHEFMVPRQWWFILIFGKYWPLPMLLYGIRYMYTIPGWAPRSTKRCSVTWIHGWILIDFAANSLICFFGAEVYSGTMMVFFAKFLNWKWCPAQMFRATYSIVCAIGGTLLMQIRIIALSLHWILCLPLLLLFFFSLQTVDYWTSTATILLPRDTHEYEVNS